MMAGVRSARDVLLVQAEQDSTFPILCETCLGDDKFVRMLKSPGKSECKACEKAYTGFRWKPGGVQSRYKQTIICQSCSKKKNVCQTCLFDLEFGLPVQVCDQLRKDYKGDNTELKRLALARSAPYYRRNRSRVCTFWLKGECKRGDECPYRHEFDEDVIEEPITFKGIKDRFNGADDPLAEKILTGRKDLAAPPADKTVTTLFLGGLENSITEDEIKTAMGRFAPIRAVRLVPRTTCAFVNFVDRAGAEETMERLFGVLKINECTPRLYWGKPPKGDDEGERGWVEIAKMEKEKKLEEEKMAKTAAIEGTTKSAFGLERIMPRKLGGGSEGVAELLKSQHFVMPPPKLK